MWVCFHTYNVEIAEAFKILNPVENREDKVNTKDKVNTTNAIKNTIKASAAK